MTNHAFASSILNHGHAGVYNVVYGQKVWYRINWEARNMDILEAFEICKRNGVTGLD